MRVAAQVGGQPTVELAASVSRPLGDIALVGLAGGTLGVGFFTVPFALRLSRTLACVAAGDVVVAGALVLHWRCRPRGPGAVQSGSGAG